MKTQNEKLPGSKSIDLGGELHDVSSLGLYDCGGEGKVGLHNDNGDLIGYFPVTILTLVEQKRRSGP